MLTACLRIDGPQVFVSPLDAEEGQTAPVDDVLPALETEGLAHLLKGMTAMSLGHAAEAVGPLRLALAYDEGSPFILSRLLHASMLAGDWDAAMRLVEQAQPRWPADDLSAMELHGIFGRVMAAKGRWEEALVHYRQAGAAHKARAVDALLWLGREAEAIALAGHDAAELFFDHGQEDALARVVAGSAPCLEARLLPTTLATFSGDDLAAARTLAAHLQACGDGSWEQQLQLSVLERRSEMPQWKSTRDASLSAQKDVNALLSVAEAYYREGDADVALALLKSSTRHLDTLAFQAQLLADLGKPLACLKVPTDRALIHARCAAQAGDEQLALRELGRWSHEGSPCHELLAAVDILIAISSPDRALSRLAELRPDCPNTQQNFAFSYLRYRQGDTEAAATMLLGPPEADADLRMQTLRGELLTLQGKPESAAWLMQQGLMLWDRDASYLNALAYGLIESGHTGDAVAITLRRAFRLDPQDPSIWDTIGFWHAQQQQWDRALTWLLRAHLAHRQDPIPLEHLGDVHSALGHPEVAKDHYRRALHAAWPIQAQRMRLEGKLR